MGDSRERTGFYTPVTLQLRQASEMEAMVHRRRHGGQQAPCLRILHGGSEHRVPGAFFAVQLCLLDHLSARRLGTVSRDNLGCREV